MTALDTEFARYLQRRWGAPPEVSTLAAELSAALREGHTFLPATAPTHPVVGEPGARVPLIQDGDRLFLHRLWAMEHRVAHALASRCQPRERALGPETSELASSLFPEDNAQKRGALLPFSFPLAVITGGPGTGKTWVLARLLALQIAQWGKVPRIALCAPTGKAAQRMAEALRQSAATLPKASSAPLQVLVPVTVHRLLLGSSPLPYDLVVVDEASMVDLHLMDALLAALDPATDLVLLGDAHQLPSVEAGRVLGDLVEWASDLASPPVVKLDRSRRFVEGQPVGVVANALRDGELAVAWPVLRGEAGRESSCVLRPEPSAKALIAELLERFSPFLRATSPRDALACLTRFLVLTVVNEGPQGQLTLNRLLRDAAPGAPWPVLITENDFRAGFSNGDLGVVFPGESGETAWFAAENGELRSCPLVLLPPHQPAFAITVHKAQGSEFDSLAVLLPRPRDDSPLVLSRELLYTAVTRAKAHCLLWGDEALLERASRTPNERRSGLLMQMERWKNLASSAIMAP